MSFIKRFTDIKRGNIIFIGNTLGLSKAQNTNSAGILGSIGAFTSLNNLLQVPSFPAGTTLNYIQNGSSANLNILSDSKILYAELVWGGLYRSVNNNIFNLINNSVRFTTPTFSTLITPDVLTRNEFLFSQNGQTIGFYTRSANVTNLLQNNFNGLYSLQSVPALIEPIDNDTFSTNHAGWTLAVIYENNSLPLRNLNYWAGGVIVSPTTQETNINISGFLTPSIAPITGKIFVSSAEGDAVISGDQMLFGKDNLSLLNLSGPNNPQNNFFASQINDSNGLIETSGTFGTRNANAILGQNTIACRQGWDITSIDLTNKLIPNQNTAAIRFISTGDLYLANSLGLQIDSKGANILANKTVNPKIVEVGQEIEYSISLTNNGDIIANNVILDDNIFTTLSLVPNSIFIDGIPYSGSFPITLGDVNINQTVNITFKAIANSLPAINPVLNIAKINYDFNPFENFTVSTSTNTNIVSVFILEKNITNQKKVNKVFALKDDILTYTSTITNNSNVAVDNVYFIDSIPSGTKFVIGSVKINGINDTTLDPEIGFFLPNLLPNDAVNVEFNVLII